MTHGCGINVGQLMNNELERVWKVNHGIIFYLLGVTEENREK